MLKSDAFYPPNGAGWRLFLKRTVDTEAFNPKLRPLAIVPGYGMNSYILGYHPTGMSMEAYLASRGFEIWSMNFRGQDFTIREGGEKDYGLRDIALVDLPAALAGVRENTRTRTKKIDVLGCSLGGTYVYAYAALQRRNPLGCIVGLGAPLRWVEIHPALRIAFGSPRVAGAIPFAFTRQLARYGLPVAAKIPGLLHIYVHPAIVDLSHPETLALTVEDPNPVLNREISEWIIAKDLLIDGVNVSERFRRVTNPLFCLQANADGIVPIPTAFSALDLAASKIKDSLVVGTDEVRLAHADLYISYYAQEMVFVPLAEWLFNHQ